MELKILIADDEPKIRRGLRHTIEQMELPVCVCAEAEDGETALEAAIKYHPDIIFVDICMPFTDGLKFIERAQMEGIKSKFIIVSGHDEFQYAQESVRLKVFSYLLKPVDMDELYSILKALVEEVKKERKKNQYFEWAQQQLTKRRDYLKEEFLREWIEGKLSEEEVEEQIDYFEMKLKSPCLLIIIPMQNVGDTAPWNRELLIFAIDNIVHELFGGNEIYLFQDARSNLVGIFEQLDWTEKKGEEISGLLEEYLERRVFVDMQKIDDYNNLTEAYEQMIKRAAEEMCLSPAVQFAQRYIHKNYANEALSLSEVAERVGINSSYLSRLMKQELGLSFMEYLSRTRVNKAIELMSGGMVKIKRLAELVGYSNQFYFSTVFKNTVGLSPANYLKEGGNDEG